MTNYKIIPNPFKGKLQFVFDGTLISFKDGVDTSTSLPTEGNEKGDARIANDTGHLYIWDGEVWSDEGDIIDIKWSAIEDKPSSTVENIDDAVGKKHEHSNQSALNDVSGVNTGDQDLSGLQSQSHVQNSDTGTQSNYFYIGDGTDTDKDIYANTTAVNKPKLRYNITKGKWQVSHDAIEFFDLAEGHDVEIVDADYSVSNGTDIYYCDSESDINFTLPNATASKKVIRIKNINTGKVTVLGYLPVGSISWCSLTNSGNRAWLDIAVSSNGEKIVACVQNGYIYTSIDSGATWTERTGAGSRFWQTVCCSADGNTIYATGLFLGVYKSINGGESWSTITSPLASVQWRRVRCSSDGSVVVLTGQRSSHVPVFTSTNGGANWTQHTVVGSGGENFRACAVSANGQTILVGASNQNPRVTVDGGANWAVKAGPGARPWYNADCSDDGSVIALVGNSNNYVYVSEDSGDNWSERQSAGARNFEAVAVNNDGSVIIVGVGYFSTGTDYLYSSNDKGVTFTQLTDAGSKQWNAVDVDNDASNLYALSYNVHITRGSTTPAERDKVDCDDSYELNFGDSVYLIDSIISQWCILSDYLKDTPDSTGSEIDDAVSDSHEQNTDTKLAEGTDDEVTANQLKQLISVSLSENSIRSDIEVKLQLPYTVLHTDTDPASLNTVIQSLSDKDILEVNSVAVYNPISIPANKELIIRPVYGKCINLSGTECIKLMNGARDCIISGVSIVDASSSAGNERGAGITFGEHQAIVSNINFYNISIDSVTNGSGVMLSYHWTVDGDRYFTPNTIEECSNNIRFLDCCFYKANKDNIEGGALALRGIIGAHIENCHFRDDSLSMRQISLQNCISAYIVDNNIRNTATPGTNSEGIKLDDLGSCSFRTTAYVSRNVIKNAVEGIDVDDNSTAVVVDNICYECTEEGISVDDSGIAVLARNLCYNCRYDSNSAGIRVENGAIVSLHQNNCVNNIIDYRIQNGYTLPPGNTSSINDIILKDTSKNLIYSGDISDVYNVKDALDKLYELSTNVSKTGTVNPTAITPDFIGQTYVNTSPDSGETGVFISNGLTEGDWVAI